jgi:modification methylase
MSPRDVAPTTPPSAPPLETTHRFIVGDARALTAVKADSVQLVVTSPPYPMIAMWDDVFGQISTEAAGALAGQDGPAAFEAMHRVLDECWAEVARVVAPGGIVAVNIGDATRTVGGQFALYSNHARIIQAMLALGLTVLPDILWRKPTNGPTKFMGSGMLPGGAYVTYEHEYVLIFRKGGKRVFSASDRLRRRRSAYFWEERNVWFSDLWQGLPGIRQGLGVARKRAASFPIELARRLIQMYACYGDVVLDPFGGTGTTAWAAASLGRSSIYVDLEPELAALAEAWMPGVVDLGQQLATRRLAAHGVFVASRVAAGKPLKHRNAAHDIPVITGQESDLEVLAPATLEPTEPGTWRGRYARALAPAPEGSPADGTPAGAGERGGPVVMRGPDPEGERPARQMKLLP